MDKPVRFVLHFALHDGINAPEGHTLNFGEDVLMAASMAAEMAQDAPSNLSIHLVKETNFDDRDLVETQTLFIRHIG